MGRSRRMIGFTPRILRVFWTDFWTVMTTGFDPGLEVNMCGFVHVAGVVLLKGDNKTKKKTKQTSTALDLQPLFFMRKQPSFTHKSHHHHSAFSSAATNPVNLIHITLESWNLRQRQFDIKSSWEPAVQNVVSLTTASIEFSVSFK